MPFWQRLLITVSVMVIMSFIAGLFWRLLLQFAMPSYLAAMVGGLASIPVWEFVKKIKIQNTK